MDGFVDAVKNWVKFELAFTAVGMIAIVLGGIKVDEYMSNDMRGIMVISFLLLLVRFALLWKVIFKESNCI